MVREIVQDRGKVTEDPGTTTLNDEEKLWEEAFCPGTRGAMGGRGVAVGVMGGSGRSGGGEGRW